MFNKIIKIISFEKIILFIEGVTCFGTSLGALTALSNINKKNIDYTKSFDYDYMKSLSNEERKKYINRYDDW